MTDDEYFSRLKKWTSSLATRCLKLHDEIDSEASAKRGFEWRNLNSLADADLIEISASASIVEQSMRELAQAAYSITDDRRSSHS